MSDAAPNALPPLIKKAHQVLLEVEQSVRRFARVDKYSVGVQLREQALQIVELAIRAWHNKAAQRQLARELVEAIDRLKIRLQLAKALHAFRSFDEFEALSRTVVDLGRQSGGWLKSLQSMGQNAPAHSAPAQRAPILSSRAAHEATP